MALDGGNEEPLVDTPAQADLIDALGPEEFGELIRTFFDGLPGGLSRIEAAVALGQCPAIASAAHTVKGSAGNMGFVRLSADAARIERAAKEGNGDLADLLARLRATIVESAALFP
ncbi:MAG TPA: Hpt domain-containing protein [Magnetospirillum sp.]|nr:Hpt domain-containing protein [Magnetospirillum sp.]